jgi:hypothetical protein
VCNPGPGWSPSRLRRIDRNEFVRDVGERMESVAASNPFDPNLLDEFSTYASDETLDNVTLELYLNVVDQAGIGWTGPYPKANPTRRLEVVKDDKKLQCMFNDAKPAADCVRYYLTTFLEKGVYFRPAASDEVDELQAFADQVLAKEGSVDDRPHSLTLITSAAWTTVPALFRSELGEGAPDASGRRRLGNWELAQAVAYAIGGRAAGATSTTAVFPAYSSPAMADLVAAAADGSITDPKVIAAFVKASAGGVDPMRADLAEDWSDNRRANRGEYWTSTGVAGFFREWLGYAKVATVFKDRPEATSQFDDPKDTSVFRGINASYLNLMSGYYGYEPTLVQQFDDAIARVVSADKDVLKTLLTTREFYVASTTISAGSSIAQSTTSTQRIYNITGDVGPTREDRWQTMPPAERAGVLTHPAWLAAHGNNFEDDPSLVHRGKWVRTQLLCDYVPPLSSVKVQAKVGPSAPDKTARDRVVEATGKTQCQGCHGLMNPLGFPFEIYNHAGFVRASDHGHAPDGSSMLEYMPDPTLDGPVKDAVDLSEKLAGSDYVKRCFLRQAFRYFAGRDETPADACALAAMEQAYDSHSGSFQAALDALFASDPFLYRSNDPQETP